MTQKITDIHCPNCGAPAQYDIIHQQYLCGYCGGRVGVSEALEQKKGLREIMKNRLKQDVKKFKLFQATCSGCGAQIVFEENEAIASCSFCGRQLVRTDYIHTGQMPEVVIPFGVTKDEAMKRMNEWCEQHKRKPESKKLKPLIPELKGFYMPYELIRGPIYMDVSRMDGGSQYYCEGFMENAFVNCSKQLDNLLLDGMEPYDLESLTEFDFAYVAGHHVKIPDLSESDFIKRAEKEAAEIYKSSVQKTMETKAVNISASVGGALHMPTLLPVYYINQGSMMAAVNGQTGKVSVRALKDSHYYFIPWWLKAILATLIFSAVGFAAFRLFGLNLSDSIFIIGSLLLFFLIVTLCLYSDTPKNSLRVTSGRKIYTSGGQTFHRENGELVLSEEILETMRNQPIFFEKLDGEMQPVVIKFSSLKRAVKMAAICLTVIFLPVLCALIITGFNFKQIHLSGSTVWFCITVPVVPIYLLQFGIVSLYEKPWIYIINDNGKKKRYKKKIDWDSVFENVKFILSLLVAPPECIIFWFAVIAFCMNVYLTAFG